MKLIKKRMNRYYKEINKYNNNMKNQNQKNKIKKK